jgi:glycosyltransferase involved in cell wall biosynthesis
MATPEESIPRPAAQAPPPSLSIFFPAYNEEAEIEKSIRAAVTTASSITPDYEVVVVDDGSRDRTGEIAERLARENPRITVVRHQTNQFYGRAVASGLGRCTKDVIFFTDADNPIQMEDIKRGLPLLGEYDVVAGFRDRRGEPFRRTVISAVFNALIRLFFGFDHPDVNFAYKLIKRRFLDGVELRAVGGFIDAEILLKVRERGGKIGALQVHYNPRQTGTSTLGSLKNCWFTFREMVTYALTGR